MEIKDLTPEQMEKAKACKTPEEVMALAKSEGIELSDEQLETVSGGNWNCWDIAGCTDVCEKYDAEWMHECWRYKRPENAECNLH